MNSQIKMYRIINNKKIFNMFSKNYFWIFLIFLSNNVLVAQDKFSNYKKYQKTNQKIKLVEVADNLNYPWGMTFIDEKTYW